MERKIEEKDGNNNAALTPPVFRRSARIAKRKIYDGASLHKNPVKKIKRKKMAQLQITFDEPADVIREISPERSEKLFREVNSSAFFSHDEVIKTFVNYYIQMILSIKDTIAPLPTEPPIKVKPRKRKQKSVELQTMEDAQKLLIKDVTGLKEKRALRLYHPSQEYDDDDCPV